MKFLRIQNTSTSSGRTSILICRLTHFKLFHKVVNLTLSFTTKSKILFVNFPKERLRLLTKSLITIFLNFFIGNNKFFYFQVRQLNIVEMMRTRVVTNQLFLILSECLVSFRL
ncbi:MAG: hypothetical protein EBZ53_06980, partial [Verrucomicrobia bacterium]|nr:hypothetical protein [Verrucomicrobiota bacterium]